MKTKRKRIGMLAFIVMIAVLMIVTMQTPGTIADSENYQCQTYATVFCTIAAGDRYWIGFDHQGSLYITFGRNHCRRPVIFQF